MSAGLKRWKPYPEYKESGVEWLGEVPAGWEVKRLKFCIKSGFQYGANIAAELDDPNLPRYIRITDMNNDGTLKDETFRSLLFEEAAPYLLQDKDILLARSGATVGKSFIYRESMGLAAYAGYLIRIATDKDSSPFFLYLFLNSQAYWQWIKSIFIQATIQNVSAEKYANFALTFPPLHEQRAIAAFLDQQCAQIDSLIEKKQRMLELLDEKRRAVITQAVTRGLDPSLPMKNSGVEWLGEVPAGWEVGRIAFGFDVVLGKMLQPTPKNECDIEVPYYRAFNVQWEKVVGDLNQMWATFEEIKKISLQQGDLLVCEGGEVGRSAFIDFPVEEPTIIQNALHRVRALEGFSTKFLLRVLEHVSSADWFSVLCNKSTIAHFTGEKFKALKSPLPPLHEQQAIADYLDAQCALMDSQRKNLEKSIELLREYRSSLITHAVTGKIDVREFAPLQ